MGRGQRSRREAEAGGVRFCESRRVILSCMPLLIADFVELYGLRSAYRKVILMFWELREK